VPPKTLMRCALLAVGLSALALGGCGRRGPLDQPQDPSLASAIGRTPDAANPATPTQKARGPIKPKEPFVLDPLL